MFKDIIFDISVLISLIVHVFWLSAISVAIAPKETNPVKFSKVAFLGPILERGALEVRIEPREHSFLEKRYMLGVDDAILRHIAAPTSREADALKAMESDRPARNYLGDLIENAVGTVKMEPSP